MAVEDLVREKWTQGHLERLTDYICLLLSSGCMVATQKWPKCFTDVLWRPQRVSWELCLLYCWVHGHQRWGLHSGSTAWREEHGSFNILTAALERGMFEFTKQYSDKFSLKTVQNRHNVLCGLSETVGMSKSIKEIEDQCIKTFAASLINASENCIWDLYIHCTQYLSICSSN